MVFNHGCTHCRIIPSTVLRAAPTCDRLGSMQPSSVPDTPRAGGDALLPSPQDPESGPPRAAPKGSSSLWRSGGPTEVVPSPVTSSRWQGHHPSRYWCRPMTLKPWCPFLQKPRPLPDGRVSLTQEHSLSIRVVHIP